MTYTLFLDDIRNPEDLKINSNEVFIVRSFKEATDFVLDNGCPKFIFFDNDLGEELDGYAFARWLVEKDMDKEIKIPIDFSWHVHSANCVSWKNIDYYLNSYLSD